MKVQGPSVLTEALLQFVWERLHFDVRQLAAVGGESLQILDPGRLNRDQGPDFSDARVRIDGQEWWGAVEIHLHSRGWYDHGHHLDSRYNHTVLHVVWETTFDPVVREDGSVIPELCLQGRIDPGLLQRLDALQLSATRLPCAPLLDQLDPAMLPAWIETLALDRIQEKGERVQQRLNALAGDWEQVLWEHLAGALGGTVNKDAFVQLTRQIPFSLIKKYTHDRQMVEALLFGSAGMLHAAAPTGAASLGHDDHFYVLLQHQWRFLKEKHHLRPQPVPLHFLRMRPPAFPTLRLSQLAGLAVAFPALTDLLDLSLLAEPWAAPVDAGHYWKTHYRWFTPTRVHPTTLGQEVVDRLLINALLPVAAHYYAFHGRRGVTDALVALLTRVKPENNRLTRLFTQHGLPHPDALYSQAYIHLYKQLCLPRACLTCAIGRHLLGRGGH